MKATIIAIALAAAAILHPAALRAQHHDTLFYGVQVEQLEYRYGEGRDRAAAWDANAWLGSDELKLRWHTEGEYDTRGDTLEKMENRLVLQKPISDFFDAKAGVRLDTPEGPDRWYGVVGVTGLAKQWFEVDADFFASETGDTSARLDVEYELLLTNRLILTPTAEIDVAFSEDREIGVGAGLSGIELGLRLSYDLVDRAVSPYLGIVYERKLGGTADFTRAEGGDVASWFAVIGTKLMF
jgi:copper resistance protein B